MKKCSEIEIWMPFPRKRAGAGVGAGASAGSGAGAGALKFLNHRDAFEHVLKLCLSPCWTIWHMFRSSIVILTLLTMFGSSRNITRFPFPR